MIANKEAFLKTIKEINKKLIEVDLDQYSYICRKNWGERVVLVIKKKLKKDKYYLKYLKYFTNEVVHTMKQAFDESYDRQLLLIESEKIFLKILLPDKVVETCSNCGKEIRGDFCSGCGVAKKKKEEDVEVHDKQTTRTFAQVNLLKKTNKSICNFCKNTCKSSKSTCAFFLPNTKVIKYSKSKETQCTNCPLGIIGCGGISCTDVHETFKKLLKLY